MSKLSRSLVTIALVCVYSSVAQGQTSDRGWIDVNVVSSTPTQDEQIFTSQFPSFGETATAAAAYPDFPRVGGFLLGGGFRIIGGLGAGLQFTRVKYEYTVGLAVNIPHPTIANRFARDADATSSLLKRADNALDISASYQLPTPDTWRVRVFGGPTLFAVKQDFVRLISYSQNSSQFGANVVDITEFESETVDESVWGLHVGGDVAFFFSRHFGVGGGFRFNRATFDVASEPLTGQRVEIKLGSTMVGGGLRIRF